MKLKTILKNISDYTIKGNREIEISGICGDSKRVSPQNLFIARRGSCFDATQFIPEAVAAGAIAVLSDIYDPFLEKNIVQIIHPNPASVEANIAATYYGQPSKELFIMGITGTKGKTTTSYLIKHLCDQLLDPCGLIGTIETITGKSRFFSTLSTPDCITMQKLLREMVSSGLKSAVVEVTSHGLDQGRIEQVDFDIALFTNLTHDHLDYHQDFQRYFLAKKKLFSSLQGNIAIINADSPYGEKIVENVDAKVFRFGIENKKADLFAKNIEYSVEKMKLELEYDSKTEFFCIPLIGKYNAYNFLGAIAVGINRGLSLSAMKKTFSSFPPIAGRFERFDHPNGFSVFVDFAHTPDALLNVLKILKQLTFGRIAVVFGCGGNRDREKRPLMASVCAEYADYCIVTTDNPRDEDPKEIISDILKGFSSEAKVFVEPDRKEAIRHAMSWGKTHDVVLIAGKGHETKQIFKTHTIDFDDRKTVLEILRE